jgi:divalent metal cation (Fe/Co/Zn/Cd) transporter
VLAGLVLIAITHDYWLDPVVALVVGAGIVIAGARLIRRATRALVDEALPESDLATIRATIRELGGPRGVVGFHKLRSRSAGSNRYVDVHLQFAAGTTLEAAHEAAHALTDEIARRLDGADVLIHIEPGDRVKPGTEITAG